MAVGAQSTTGLRRERGWAGILLALAVFLLVPKLGPLRLIAPVEQTVLLIAPAIAVSMLVAWSLGGRLSLAIPWVLASVWMLWQPIRGTGDFDPLARGWAILLAAIFGVVGLAGTRRSFLTRALSAVALTFAFASAVVLVSNVSPSRVQRSLASELSRRFNSLNTQLVSRAREPDPAVGAVPRAVSRVEEGYAQRLRAILGGALPLYPALLALESLAALALAWGLFHRISRVRIGPPLSPLRGFRMSEELIWGLLVGIAILVIPNLDSLRGLGLNLTLVFGALYALRGLGVITWAITPRLLAIVFFVVLAVVWAVFWPGVAQIFFFASVCLGLADNWLDWRSRARQAT